MITSASKTSAEALEHIAGVIFANKPFMTQAFADCDNEAGVVEALRAGYRWNVLISERPVAVFTLHTSGMSAIVEHFCPEGADVLATSISDLRNYLRRSKKDELTMNVSEDLVEPLLRSGLEKRTSLIRLSTNVVETNSMPILPLSNPTERDIPTLAKLMEESYSKGNEKPPSNLVVVEKTLREIMGGSRGTFLQESSFISKATDKIVSACLVISTGTRTAIITELFTHPLYRARGLATTEIMISMNRLLKRKIPTLSVWIRETNDVAKRLFEKLNFKKDLRLLQMSMRI